MGIAMRGVNGLHHITAIAGPAQENLDFYAGMLGMRLVKRSVNQDDPGTYHLFYADAEGQSGQRISRSFRGRTWRRREPAMAWPWKSISKCRRAALGTGRDRLQRYGTSIGPTETRFGQKVLALSIRTA